MGNIFYTYIFIFPLIAYLSPEMLNIAFPQNLNHLQRVS